MYSVVEIKRIPSLIIVEGPNLSGKNKFIGTIPDDAAVKVNFEEAYTKSSYTFYEKAYNMIITAFNKAARERKDVVLRRSWISDAVYNNVMGKTEYNALAGICSLLFKNIITIIFTCDKNELFTHRSEDIVESIDTKFDTYDYYELIKINERYCKIYDVINTSDKVLPYDKSYVLDLSEKYGLILHDNAHLILTKDMDASFDDIIAGIHYRMMKILLDSNKAIQEEI